MSEPRWSRLEAGAVTITALQDGMVEAPLDVLPGADLDVAARFAAEEGFPLAPMRIDVNAFAWQGPLGLTLVDAGAGGVRGPNLGHLPAALAAAGIAPDAVETILLTHMHVDHAAGLVDGGAPLFPRARLVVGAAEAAFWRSDRPAGRQATQVEFARSALDAYAGRLDFVAPGQTLGPGIEAMDLSGHTPGMLGYRIGGLLFCGDIANVPRLQFPCPDWGHVFDANQEAACARRRNVLSRAAQDGTVLAGAHLPFPGIGRVLAHDEGFRFIPA